jgi:hypothetical protein
MKKAKQTTWNVFRSIAERWVKIDTVFYDGDMTAEEIRRSLINHDGYSADILVIKGRNERK